MRGRGRLRDAMRRLRRIAFLLSLCLAILNLMLFAFGAVMWGKDSLADAVNRKIDEIKPGEERPHVPVLDWCPWGRAAPVAVCTVSLFCAIVCLIVAAACSSPR